MSQKPAAGKHLPLSGHTAPENRRYSHRTYPSSTNTLHHERRRLDYYPLLAFGCSVPVVQYTLPYFVLLLRQLQIVPLLVADPCSASSSQE
jgi:hypothetical protein